MRPAISLLIANRSGHALLRRDQTFSRRQPKRIGGHDSRVKNLAVSISHRDSKNPDEAGSRTFQPNVVDEEFRRSDRIVHCPPPRERSSKHGGSNHQRLIVGDART